MWQTGALAIRRTTQQSEYKLLNNCLGITISLTPLTTEIGVLFGFQLSTADCTEDVGWWVGGWVASNYGYIKLHEEGVGFERSEQVIRGTLRS